MVLRATGDDFGDFDGNPPPTIQVANVSALEEAGVVTVPITMSGPSTLMQFVQVDVAGSASDVVRTRVVRTLLPGETTDSFDVVCATTRWPSSTRSRSSRPRSTRKRSRAP
jgi:hypothetical protein